MKLDALIQFFEERLQRDMPGEMAHRLMQPKLQNGSRIRFNHADEAKEGGVLILLYEEDGIVKFPLIERPEYDGIHSGQISLPGGKKELADTDLIQTALREAEEEIGIAKKDLKVIGSLSQFFVGASNYDILPVIATTEKLPLFKADPREVKEIITPATHDLIKDQNKAVGEISVRHGYVLSSPYYNLENKMVWGATAMMLSEFAALLEEFQSDR